MSYKLNTDGWLLALGASLTIAIAAGLTVYIEGLGWFSGVWIAIALIVVRWTYENYKKEKY